MKKITISNITHIKSLFEGDGDVTNRAVEAVLDGDTETPWWLICITSGSGFPIIQPNRMNLIGCQGVLPVAFDDMVPNKKYWKDPEAWKKSFDFTYRLPYKGHAQDIIRMLNVVKADERLVVNCEAGVSRSAAVAYFAAQYMGFVLDEEFERDYYHPNPLVGVLLREESGFMSREESWKLLKDSPNRPNPWGDKTK